MLPLKLTLSPHLEILKRVTCLSCLSLTLYFVLFTDFSQMNHLMEQNSRNESRNGDFPYVKNEQSESIYFTKTRVHHRAGLFSQIFQFLYTFTTDMARTSNSSSANWKIVEYSPGNGSGWEASHFEKVFLPVRLSNPQPTSKLFYWHLRTQARSIFRLRPELERVLSEYHRQLNLQRNSTICAHVRRGDKQEGINRLSDVELLDAFKWSSSDSTKALYLLTDDSHFIDTAKKSLESSLQVTTFPELQCSAQTGVGNLECFVISVMLATKVCHTFIGSSTSNLSRFLMLLGPRFYDLDGVVDFFASSVLGAWYFPHDHCYIVDRVSSNGDMCGHLSHRCPYCKRTKCTLLPECEMPP